MQKLVTCLWFDDQAEEAAKYYTSIFKNSKIGAISYYGEGMHRPKEMVLTITFELDGQQFMALNGGPEFTFSEAISVVVYCETQAEIDELWEKLSEGGEKGQCGWLKDKFGLSWQIVPTILMEMEQSPNSAKTQYVMQAVLGMNKLDIAALKKAYERG
jgi:predicted 3-demethylubiquinone-9 3-methyltransferase (glyoxalase superfamily)